MTLPNSTYRGVSNSHCFGQGVAAFCAVQNFSNLRIAQFAVSVPLTFSNRSMANGILPVCPRITVIKIVRRIIFAVAVFVANHRTVFWSRSYEGGSHNPMHGLAVNPIAYTQRDLQSSCAVSGLFKYFGLSAAAVQPTAAYLRAIRNLIQRGFGDDFPYFFHARAYGMKPSEDQARALRDGGVV